MKKKKKVKEFSIRFLQYSEIKGLSSHERIEKILEIVSEDKILILQGKLNPNEKTYLIEETMNKIGNSKNFKGIEFAVLSENKDKKFFEKIKNVILKIVYGSEIGSLTIIGPATIIKEIKKDPKKIELFLNR